MNLALFGGSFDPPHRGHLRIVEEALKHLPIDTLILVPAWQNPFKTVVHADGKTRYEWLKTIFSTYKNVAISDFEISQNQCVYTIETVRHYQAQSDRIYLIIGADNLAGLPRWNSYEELSLSVTFVVATRNGVDIPEEMIRLDVEEPISSTQVRNMPMSLGLDPEIEKNIIPYYKEHHESKS